MKPILSIIKRTTLLITTLVIAAGFFPAAHAATVQFNSGMTAATGITGLDVGGTLYDVNFTGSITHNNWATMLDVTNQTDATNVIQAIGDALDAASAAKIEYDLPGGGTFEHTGASLFYDTTATDLLGVSITATSGWGFFVGGSTAPLNNSFPFAIDLTVSTVPVPAAAWLFGSGLLGLIGLARRKV